MLCYAGETCWYCCGWLYPSAAVPCPRNCSWPCWCWIIPPLLWSSSLCWCCCSIKCWVRACTRWHRIQSSRSTSRGKQATAATDRGGLPVWCQPRTAAQLTSVTVWWRLDCWRQYTLSRQVHGQIIGTSNSTAIEILVRLMTLMYYCQSSAVCNCISISTDFSEEIENWAVSKIVHDS